MSGVSFHCCDCDHGVNGFSQVEVRDAANQPAVHRTAPTTKDDRSITFLCYPYTPSATASVSANSQMSLEFIHFCPHAAIILIQVTITFCFLYNFLCCLLAPFV